MKKTNRIIISVLASLTVVTGLLTVIGILLLPAKIASPEEKVQENVSGIGYREEIPPAALLFCFPDTSGVFLSLDFSSLLTTVYLFEEDAEEKAAALPYFTDFTFNAGEEFLPLLADRLGGIEMTDETGEARVYFSAALSEFCEKELNEEQRQKLALSFFDKIAKTGLSSEDFMFIIENTENSLSYSRCYDWIPYIKTMFSNYILG